MATENTICPAPEEQVSPVAEDVQTAPAAAEQTIAEANTCVAEEAPAQVPVDFTAEEAELAAAEAGLELDEETAEEAAHV